MGESAVDELNDITVGHETPASDDPPVAADDEALFTYKGMLRLHPEDTLREAIIASRTAGSDELWSNDKMNGHLHFLAKSFKHTNETTLQIIDTFFFRLIAMVSPPQRGQMITWLKSRVPIVTVHPRLSQTDTISGIIDCTPVVPQSSIAEKCIIHRTPLPSQRDGDEMAAFFLFKANNLDISSLVDHLPQALGPHVTCAKHFGKSHIRGALTTTGYQWRFVVVDLDTDGNGASYWVSELIEWRAEQDLTSRLVEETSHQSGPALIAGILSSWILEGFAEFNGDQWFVCR